MTSTKYFSNVADYIIDWKKIGIGYGLLIFDISYLNIHLKKVVYIGKIDSILSFYDIVMNNRIKVEDEYFSGVLDNFKTE